MVAAGIEAAKTLKGMSSDKLQMTAQELGFAKIKSVVAEMLYGPLSEQTVTVAMEILQAEQDRMVAARCNIPRQTVLGLSQSGCVALMGLEAS